MDDARKQMLTLLVVALLAGGSYVAFEVVGPGASEPNEAAAQDRAEPASGSDGEAGSGAEPATAEVSERPSRAERERSERTVTLETDELVARISNLNTGLRSVTLKGERYQSDDEEKAPEELVSTDQPQYLPFRIELAGDGKDNLLSPAHTWELESSDEREVRFRYEGDGLAVARSISAGKGPYQLWSTTRIRNTSDRKRTLQLKVATYEYVLREEEGGGFLGRPSPYRGLGVCRYGPEDDRETERKDREDLLEKHGYGPPVRFTGVENTYFAKLLAAHQEPAHRCALHSDNRFLAGQEDPVGSLFHVRLVYPKVELAPGKETTIKTLGYFGPKTPEALQAAGHGLPEAVDLGWFAFIAEYMVKLLSFIQSYVGNWGLAIILLTVLVKLLLYPLTEKSFQSMAKMRHLKPEMDRINELYKDDREKKGAAMMELYRKHKINPLGGCLPTLFQLPVWLALYQSLSTNVEIYHADFILWWTDLSAPDPTFALPIAVAGLMFLQQRITPTAMDPAQAKMMMYFMPVMMGAFLLFLPAGLCLYILTNSALGIAQQQFIHYRLERQPSPAGASGSSGDGSPDTTPPQNEPGSSTAAAQAPKKATSKPSRRRSRGGAKRRRQSGRA